MNASNYDLNISNDIEDPEWDNFVVESSGGHYSQSSKWAQIKASHGWKIIRGIISSENRIVAGVQILIRKISPFINLAYISKCPLSGIISKSRGKCRNIGGFPKMRLTGKLTRL